jgi:histone H3/H4
MGESLVVKAKIKDEAKGFNVSGDFADALSEKVSKLIKKACERAEANSRKTVMAKDL